MVHCTVTFHSERTSHDSWNYQNGWRIASNKT